MHDLLRRTDNDLIDVAATATAIRSRFPGSDVAQLEYLVGVALQVAKNAMTETDGKRLPQHLWLFELAGRLKGALPEGLRSEGRIGTLIAPLALLFIDAVEAMGGLSIKKRRIAYNDADAVLLEFEEVWYKRRFAKGSPYVDEAILFAKSNPLDLEGNPYFVQLLNVAFYLQLKQPDQPILLPVSAPLASKMQTTPVTLGTAITKAIREGFLEVVDGHFDLKAGKARSFRLNLDHPAIRPKVPTFS